MLNNKEIKEILAKNELADVEQIAVIERYIFDKKGVELNINRPNNVLLVQLMDHMYNCALKYYTTDNKI